MHALTAGQAQVFDGALDSLMSVAVLRFAAKAFLEPGLHAGTLTLEDAVRVLRDDVVLSRETVGAEIERYTTLWPGQAPSYLHGYLRELELRADAEVALGGDFHARKYHDFLLSAGRLSHSRRGGWIREKYVPQTQKISTDHRPPSRPPVRLAESG